MTNSKATLSKLPEAQQEMLLEGVTMALNNWKGYMDCMSKIPDYSANNTLLIMLQQLQRKRDFSPLVRGYKTWTKDFKRHVVKGTKGYKILAPVMVPLLKNGQKVLKDDGKPVMRPANFRAISIFDHRDTEGEPLPQKPDTSHVMAQQDGKVDYMLLNGLLEVAKARKVTINRCVSKDELGTAHGCCWFTNEDGTASKIDLREDLTEITEVTVLMHELAHSILHNRDEYEGHSPLSIKELEAESTAYLVAKHYGIDTSAKAFDYIIGHNLKDPDLKTTMLDAGTRINKAYKEIITIVDKHLKDKKR
tara:strand:+ start:89 stop:1006 length:918 start_codon:yes stop_codon:yes gene_type:complete